MYQKYVIVMVYALILLNLVLQVSGLRIKEEASIVEQRPIRSFPSAWERFHTYLFLPKQYSSAHQHVWPELELNWHVILGSIIGFLGASFGSVGGVGGGGIFVPMLTLIIGFDQKTSTALSKCMVMGASAATVWFNFRLKHPTKACPIIDYDLALLFQPMLMLGISVGVILNVVFPNWMVTILLIILFTVTSSRTFMKGMALWKQETTEKQLKEERSSIKFHCEEGMNDGDYASLEGNATANSESLCFNINWQGISILLFVWISFLFLQIIKNHLRECSYLYWVCNFLQIPVAIFVFLKEAVSLYSRSKAVGEQCFVCSAEVNWTVQKLLLCATSGMSAGIVGGLLGLGGGFILGPLFLELDVPPEVSGATATFVMLFSSSMSVIEYHLLHRFPVPFALYLFLLSVLAGFWGQYVIRRLIRLLGRTSIMIFILSTIVFISAISLGGYGIQDSIIKLQNKEYMGFLSLCQDDPR